MIDSQSHKVVVKSNKIEKNEDSLEEQKKSVSKSLSSQSLGSSDDSSISAKSDNCGQADEEQKNTFQKVHEERRQNLDQA